MILGISVKDDRMLLAAYSGSQTESEFKHFDFSLTHDKDDKKAGFLWDLAGKSASEYYRNAEEIILAVPASVNFVKRLVIPFSERIQDPVYLKWLAEIQLPGGIANYAYGFIQLRKSFDETKVEMLLYAAPMSIVQPLIFSLKRDDDVREIVTLPEQLGLIQILSESMGEEESFQSAIVHIDNAGATAIVTKGGGFSHGKYFRKSQSNDADLSSDIETYLLSRADPSEPMPLIITGSSGDFETKWSPILPSILEADVLDFAPAWE